MTVAARAVSVLSTATRLDTTTEQWDQSSLVFYNNGSETVYLGGSGVTTATGVPVSAGQFSPSIDSGKDAIYGIVATGPCEVRVLEAGI